MTKYGEHRQGPHTYEPPVRGRLHLSRWQVRSSPTHLNHPSSSCLLRATSGFPCPPKQKPKQNVEGNKFIGFRNKIRVYCAHLLKRVARYRQDAILKEKIRQRRLDKLAPHVPLASGMLESSAESSAPESTTRSAESGTGDGSATSRDIKGNLTDAYHWPVSHIKELP